MHVLRLFLYLFILVLCSCSSSGDGSSPETGALSLSLQFPQSAISTADAPVRYKAISDRCVEFGISVLDAKVYDEDNVLLARGGPWSCDAGQGSLTRIKHGNNRSVRVNLNNDEGRLILTGKKSNITVIAGKVAEAVIEIDFLSSEEVFLDALNDCATVNRGGTVTVLDSGYASLLHNDIAPDTHSLTADTKPISGPDHGNLTLYADGTFRYTHDGRGDTTDSFTYEAKDAHGGSDTATVNIIISPDTSNHAPALGSALVSPETGGTDTVFTFSIHYTDQDGHNPSARHVYIDGIPHLMALTAGHAAWDGTYTYTTRLQAGPHTYYYSFSDGHGGSARVPASGYSSGITVTGPLNHAPVLNNGSISPNEGNSGETFTYSVHYSDPDNDPAVTASVYIDGTPYTMELSSGSAWDGTYTYSTTLGPGPHTYYFSFTDGNGGFAQAPTSGTSSGPSVAGPPNHAPVIDSPGVNPVDGSTGIPYTYSVRYSDQDGDRPSTGYVYIDGNAHIMALSSGTESNGTYTFSTTLPPGTHAYYFSFSDGKGGSARLPVIDSYAGPFVNHSPVLAGASVSPGSGTTSQTFTYSIHYSDPDGQAPSTRYVYIDGTPHDMTFASGASLSNGIYTFQTSLGPGSHTYYFLFSDGNGGSARQPGTGVFSGPLVNNPPSLGSPYVNPDEGTTATIFTFSIHYSDPDGNSPATASVYIDGSARGMTLASGTPSNGTYTYQGTLSPGTHSYYFSFSDGSGGAARFPASGAATGPTVNHPPALEGGTVDPGTGTTATTFTYSVHYTDQDGDMPLNAYVYIDGSAYTMTLSSGTASNGTYTCSRVLSAQAHTYYFAFTDEHGDYARLPASGSYSGPSLSQANVVYVDPVNGQTGNSGRSWSLAVPGIPQAVAAADPGDQIWVKQGFYLLTQPIEITKDLELYGGFVGSETYLSQRDFTANTVFVDGQGLTRCFSISGSAGTVVMDGFCIQNGSSPSNPGGGISNTLPVALGVFNCTFRNNSASWGGGINNSNSASTLTVENCLFEGNTASTGYAGGGIYGLSADTRISRSVFRGNTAGDGGGVAFTGPAVCIVDSLFYDNTAYTPLSGNRGGGIAIWNSENAAVTNCTIYGNQASYKGGGIFCENSSLEVWNSIVRSNSFGVYKKQIFGLSSTVTVRFSDVELASDESPWDPSCIDEDPAFIDPAAGDFRLTHGSPCIDEGFNEAPCMIDADLAGSPRIIGGIVDMGAYEFEY